MALHRYLDDATQHTRTHNMYCILVYSVHIAHIIHNTLTEIMRTRMTPV